MNHAVDCEGQGIFRWKHFQIFAPFSKEKKMVAFEFLIKSTEDSHKHCSFKTK